MAVVLVVDTVIGTQLGAADLDRLTGIIPHALEWSLIAFNTLEQYSMRVKHTRSEFPS